MHGIQAGFVPPSPVFTTVLGMNRGHRDLLVFLSLRVAYLYSSQWQGRILLAARFLAETVEVERDGLSIKR